MPSIGSIHRWMPSQCHEAGTRELLRKDCTLQTSLEGGGGTGAEINCFLFVSKMENDLARIGFPTPSFNKQRTTTRRRRRHSHDTARLLSHLYGNPQVPPPSNRPFPSFACPLLSIMISTLPLLFALVSTAAAQSVVPSTVPNGVAGLTTNASVPIVGGGTGAVGSIASNGTFVNGTSMTGNGTTGEYIPRSDCLDRLRERGRVVDERG